MRKKLKGKIGKTLHLTATFIRDGDKDGRVLVTNVRNKSKVLSDHNWLMVGNYSDKITIRSIVSFTASVSNYTDSYGITKVGLTNITNFMLNADNITNTKITENRTNQKLRGKTKWKR